jgi:hypothetical protein
MRYHPVVAAGCVRGLVVGDGLALVQPALPELDGRGVLVRDVQPIQTIQQPHQQGLCGSRLDLAGPVAFGDQLGRWLDALHDRAGCDCRDDGRKQPVAVDRGDRLPDAWCRTQRGFHLAELDPVPTELDLVVGPAEELQRAVRPVPALVACPVPALTVDCHEPFGGASGVVAIAARHPDTADPQLTRQPVRAVPALLVDDPVPLVAQRIAVRNRPPVRIDVIHVERVGPDRGFGRAAECDEPAPRRPLRQPPGQVETNPVTGDEHQPQLKRLLLSNSEQHVEQRGHRVPDRDAKTVDQLQPAAGVAAVGLVDQDDGASG